METSCFDGHSNKHKNTAENIYDVIRGLFICLGISESTFYYRFEHAMIRMRDFLRILTTLQLADNLYPDLS